MQVQSEFKITIIDNGLRVTFISDRSLSYIVTRPEGNQNLNPDAELDMYVNLDSKYAYLRLYTSF